MASEPKKFTLPNHQQRIAVIGHTGCGKTQLATWLLSEASIETMPWVVIDYKGDDLISSIPYHQEIGYNEIPKKPGVYILRARPDQNERVESYLWRVWERGKVGLFVDEAYTMPDKGAYQTVLIQGRSKQIPMINNTQKPSWIPGQVFSESDYYSAFYLNDKRDQKRVNEFMPVDFEVELPEYHSWYYRVKDRQRFLLKPVPDADTLLETFARRLAPKRRMV